MTARETGTKKAGAVCSWLRGAQRVPPVGIALVSFLRFDRDRRGSLAPFLFP